MPRRESSARHTSTTTTTTAAATTAVRRTAIVLLGFLLGLASSRRTHATTLEARWETLFARSVLGISGDNDYLMGVKRVRRLYCNVGIGFHLQVLPDGRINGVHDENQYSESHP